MKAYADYAFYKDNFKGTKISETDFTGWVISASAYLDYITIGRIRKLSVVPEEVKYAVCATVDAMKKAEERDGVASESVGKHSVSYTDKYSSENKGYLYKVVEPFLLPTGLLHRGLD